MVGSVADAIEQVRGDVRRRLASTVAATSRSPLGLDVVSLFVRDLRTCVDDLNRAAGMPDQVAGLISGSVLQAGFTVFLHCRHHRADHASDMLWRIWADHAAVFGLAPESPARSSLPSEPLEPTPEDWEYLSLFNVAVGTSSRQNRGAVEGRRILRRLIGCLDLSLEDVGRMFDVRGETVRRWEHGLTPLPSKRLAELTAAEAALDRLLHLFRPERLPVAIRRPAELFDGQRALDWVLQGRLADVADRYDRVLAYQA